MVRFATAQFRAGHLPLTSWFPYLGEGSPQFLHYQSLGAMLTGLAGLITGPDAAFRWSLYLLLCLWPLIVYASARLFDIARWPAATAAAMAPFIVSVPGVGYEQHAYVWLGYGVWAQLWGATTLPLAWGFSWRALRLGRGYAPAACFTALTVAFHFETGYLALFPLLVWPFVVGQNSITRVLRREIILLGGSLALSAWVLVPVIAESRFAAVNEALRGTPLENGYGAAKVLDWLITGRVLDDGRLPVLTVFAAVGSLEAALRWRRDSNVRALLVVLCGSLLLSFGRTTFGSLAALVPGAEDIFFRRFMMGAQLALVLLAGQGAVRAGVLVWRGCWWWHREGDGVVGGQPPTPAASPYLSLVALVLVLAPAWLQLGTFDDKNANAIASQNQADLSAGRLLTPLIRRIDAGKGRVYAGMPDNWGSDMRVGAVPVFKYLDSYDVDEVGYTLRTASLMTGPEDHFQEANPSDYRLFGIRYLILPAGKTSPVSARLLLRSGPYALWQTRSNNGYVALGTLSGVLAANRTNLGARTIGVLDRGSTQASQYVEIKFGATGPTTVAGTPQGTAAEPAPEVGTVNTTGSPIRGRITATVRMRNAGVVVLSASFDPGWHVTVDGHVRPTVMVAPALTAVRVGAGLHQVVFVYRGYGGYLELLLLSVTTLGVLLLVDSKMRV